MPYTALFQYCNGVMSAFQIGVSYSYNVNAVIVYISNVAWRSSPCPAATITAPVAPKMATSTSSTLKAVSTLLKLLISSSSAIFFVFIFYISNVFDSDNSDDIGHCNLFVFHLVNRFDSYSNKFHYDIKLPELTNFDLNFYVIFCCVIFFINNLFSFYSNSIHHLRQSTTHLNLNINHLTSLTNFPIYHSTKYSVSLSIILIPRILGVDSLVFRWLFAPNLNTQLIFGVAVHSSMMLYL